MDNPTFSELKRHCGVASIECDVSQYGVEGAIRNIGHHKQGWLQYEFQLAMTNRAVAGIETIFVMTSEEFGFTSSTIIREIAALGGNVSNLIQQQVYEKLQKRLAEKGTH